MDRNNRDARRSTTISTTMTPPSSNGMMRRRHRTRVRDSPGFIEDDGPVELPDTLRNGWTALIGTGTRNKRRRGDGNNNHSSIHHGGSGNRRDELGMAADESFEESVNDNEEVQRIF